MDSRPSKILMGVTVMMALVGCTQTSAPPPSAAGSVAAVPAPGAPPPHGGGCAGEIARTRAVVESDLATGNVGASVGSRFRSDLDQAQAACSGGRDAEAIRLVQAAKARYGYNR